MKSIDGCGGNLFAHRPVSHVARSMFRSEGTLTEDYEVSAPEILLAMTDFSKVDDLYLKLPRVARFCNQDLL